MKKQEKIHYILVPEQALRWYSPALLLGDILRMSKRCPCTAPNEFFAQRYGVSPDTIRRGLRQLKRAGMLRVEPCPGSRSGRALVPCLAPAQTPGQDGKKCGTPPANAHTPNIRKKYYVSITEKTSVPAPQKGVRPEERTYTLAQLMEMNLR